MRKKTVLIALAILALGLTGTGFSTLYRQSGYIGDPPVVTFKVSLGFPLGWYGHSHTEGSAIPVNGYPETYWFSLGSFLLDATFWVATSSFVCIAAMKSVNLLRKTRASKNLSATSI